MTTPQFTSQFLTAKQAAAYLNCSTRTISRLTSEGRLRAHMIGRLVRYTPGDLRAVAVPTDVWTQES